MEIEIGPQPTPEYWKEQCKLCKDHWYLYTWFITYPGKKYCSREDLDKTIDQFNNGGTLSLWRRSRVQFY